MLGQNSEENDKSYEESDSEDFLESLKVLFGRKTGQPLAETNLTY